MKLSNKYKLTEGFAVRRTLGIACSAMLTIAGAQAAQTQFDATDLLEDTNNNTVVPYLAPEQVQIKQSDNLDFLNFASELVDTTFQEQFDSQQFRRKLWQTRLEPVKEPAPSDNNTDLIEAVSKLSSIQMPLPSEQENRKAQAKEFLGNILDASPKTNTAGEPNTEKSAAMIATTEILEDTLTTDMAVTVDLSVEEAMKETSRVSNPLKLADVLYKDGKLTQAAFFYKIAYEKLSNRFASESDLAWVLFQLGNCLRHSEPSEAIISYKQLISQYPQSPWSDAGQTMLSTLEWQRQEKPQEVTRK